MGHSSIDMTMKHYTHLALRDIGRPVEMLPDFEHHRTTADTMNKTRTDDSVLRGDQKMVPKCSLQRAFLGNKARPTKTGMVT